MAALHEVATAIDSGSRPGNARCQSPNCHASIKIGAITRDYSAYRAMCTHAMEDAAGHGFAIVPIIREVTGSMTYAEGKTAIQELISEGANVFVYVGDGKNQGPLLKAQEELNWSPLANILQWSMEDDVINGYWQGDQIIKSGTGFFPGNPGDPVDFAGFNSATFAGNYSNRWLGGDTSDHHSGAWMAMTLLSAAIERAGSIATEDVKVELERTNIKTIYGAANFTYDEHHQGSYDMVVVQTLMAPDATLASQIRKAVAPPNVATQPMAFPASTWNQRRCRHFGPGAPLNPPGSVQASTGAWIPTQKPNYSGMECSGHGSCSTDGECVCTGDYEGTSCELVIMPRPASLVETANELRGTLNCRTAAAAAMSDCYLTPYVCGATCIDMQSLYTTITQLTYVGQVKESHHLSLSNFAATGDPGALAVLACTVGSVANISFAKITTNTQNGTGGTAAFVTASTLTLTFSSVQANVNTGSGSAGIFVQGSSTLSVLHTDFAHNQMQLARPNSSSAITCDTSNATVANSKFSHNQGAPVVFLAHSFLQMQHCAVHNNTAMSAPVMVSGSSMGDIHTTLFMDNTGSLAGAIFVTGSGSKMVVEHSTFHSNQGVSLARGSGVILATEGANCVIRNSIFQNNLGTAPIAAGALMAENAAIDISGTLFQLNYVQGNPHATSGSGGIYSERCSMTMSKSIMSHNDAIEGADGHASTQNFGKEFYAMFPQKAYIHDSTFEAFDDEVSALIVPGVSRGKMRGSCSEHPCNPGFGCTYANASLTCTPCSATTHSAEGMSCDACAPDLAPNPNRTACDCAPGFYALTEGETCKPCSNLELPARLDLLNIPRPDLGSRAVCPGGVPGKSAGFCPIRGLWVRYNTMQTVHNVSAPELLACESDDACVSVEDCSGWLENHGANLCGEGTEGFLCRQCAEGYTKVGGQCFECNGYNFPTLFVALLLNLATALFLLHKSTRVTVSGSEIKFLWNKVDIKNKGVLNQQHVDKVFQLLGQHLSGEQLRRSLQRNLDAKPPHYFVSKESFVRYAASTAPTAAMGTAIFFVQTFILLAKGVDMFGLGAVFNFYIEETTGQCLSQLSYLQRYFAKSVIFPCIILAGVHISVPVYHKMREFAGDRIAGLTGTTARLIDGMHTKRAVVHAFLFCFAPLTRSSIETLVCGESPLLGVLTQNRLY